MTNQEIKDTGLLIKNEQQIGGNTARRVGGVIEGIGYALDNKDAANGYYQATINGGSISVNAPNFVLGNGGNLRLKMPAAGTTASTLTIGNANAVQLWYNGAAVSSDNTWEQDEIISVFYDGTRFMASNSQGGGGKAEKIKYDNSQSGLAAGNVQEAVDSIVFNESDNVNLNARIGLAQGSTSTVDGAIINTATNRVYTYDKLFGKGTFHVKTNSGFIIRNIIIYNSDNTFNKTYFNGDGLEVTDMYITVEEGKYARVSFCKTNTSASILPTDNIISQCKFVSVGNKLDAVGDVVLKSVSIPFVEGYYIAGANSDYGTTVKDSSSAATHLLKIADYDKIYYTGKTGIVWAMFYDNNKSPINHVGVTNLMVKDVEVLQYAPANAVYVKLSSRILSASNPPSAYPHAYGLQKSMTKDEAVDVLKNGVQAYYDMSCRAFYNNGEYTPFTTTDTSIPIEFGSLEHLYYTGSMGGEVANWFDEDGEWIGSNVNSNGSTLVNVDILPNAIAGAKYVTLSSRNSSHSTPPSVPPNITAYLYSRDMSVDSLFERFNVPNDGVTDATTALQNVIGASGEVVDFKPGTYIISAPLQIDTAIVKVLNGNNAILKVNGDVAAINMYGTCTTNTASPATLTEAQKLEASTIIRELRITSSSLNQGEGIVITNTFQPVIEKCFIYNIKNGIVFRGRNRNGIIEGNNIWYCYNAGLLIDSGMNMHQCNIYGNHISYCQICVHVNNPMQLANFQFVGNDIEIAEVPDHDLTDTRCIVFNYSATQYALCSEFEFSGNTIQGHNHSDSLIEFHGNSTIKIENVSFAGNQISNCNGNAIELSHVHNFAFCGNTYRLVYGKVFNLSKTIDGLTISNEVCESGSTGFMGCESDAVLNAVTLNGCTGRGMTGGITLSATTINGLSICCNNIASSNVTVSATNLDYVNVFGNMCRATYNIGTCTHSNISNNI
jgi:hypothetical protein